MILRTGSCKNKSGSVAMRHGAIVRPDADHDSLTWGELALIMVILILGSAAVVAVICDALQVPLADHLVAVLHRSASRLLATAGE